MFFPSIQSPAVLPSHIMAAEIVPGTITIEPASKETNNRAANLEMRKKSKWEAKSCKETSTDIAHGICCR